MRFKTLRFAYKNLLKPIFFRFDPEAIHDFMVSVGQFVGDNTLTDTLLQSLFAYESNKLHTKVLGVDFPNPIGLAAGFDYDAHLVKVMSSVGFGFSTVGTVTFSPYDGNQKPRLARLPKSQSLLVNKGFKSQGVNAVLRRLEDPALEKVTFGVSVGSSNVPEVSTVNVAIEDYLASFSALEKSPFIKYYELNISCPNTAMRETFSDPINFSKLIEQVSGLKLTRPIFVKMPNELPVDQSDELVRFAMQKNVRGFIFSNLVKDRANPAFNRLEIERVGGLKGNFSGKPTEQNANNLIAFFRKKYGSDIAIIGCGGVFTPADAIAKFNAGADLVQLITGMIFEGPQLPGEICSHLG